MHYNFTRCHNSWLQHVTTYNFHEEYWKIYAFWCYWSSQWLIQKKHGNFLRGNGFSTAQGHKAFLDEILLVLRRRPRRKCPGSGVKLLNGGKLCFWTDQEPFWRVETWVNCAARGHRNHTESPTWSSETERKDCCPWWPRPMPGVSCKHRGHVVKTCCEDC